MSRSLGALLLVGLILGGLGACSKPLTVEQRIIATIREMEAKIEDAERGAFMTHIAQDFEGQGGLVNRDRVRAMVIFQLNRYKNLQAQLLPIRVSEVSDTTASAAFSALVTGGKGLLPESGQVFNFETRWRLDDNEWLLYSASWDPVTLDEAL